MTLCVLAKLEKYVKINIYGKKVGRAGVPGVREVVCFPGKLYGNHLNRGRSSSIYSGKREWLLRGAEQVRGSGGGSQLGRALGIRTHVRDT